MDDLRDFLQAKCASPHDLQAECATPQTFSNEVCSCRPSALAIFKLRMASSSAWKFERLRRDLRGQALPCHGHGVETARR